MSGCARGNEAIKREKVHKNFDFIDERTRKSFFLRSADGKGRRQMNASRDVLATKSHKIMRNVNQGPKFELELPMK